MWQIEVTHPGLNRYRLVRGQDQWVVEQKAAAQRAQWDAMWAKQQAREQRLSNFYWGKGEAEARSREAGAALDELRGLLADALNRNHTVRWEALKSSEAYGDAQPIAPDPKAYPPQPKPLPKLPPELSLLDYLVPALKRRALAIHDAVRAKVEAEEAAQLDHWEAQKRAVDAANEKAAAGHRAECEAWEERRQAFDKARDERNRQVDEVAVAAARGDEAAIASQITVALTLARLPEPFSSDFEVEYVAETRSCVIDRVFPSPDQMPTLRDVKYVQARHELIEKHISESERARMYDDVLYKAALHALHVVFGCDNQGYIERVTLNGWVDFVNKSNGMDDRACVLSVAANRSDLNKIDLHRVDPKECFRSLKGVAASKLVGLAPVAPLQRMRTTDPRFVASEDVVSTMEAGINVAAMDWKEFEHLVRQVFENEFASSGSEVRVTQASRDGGVDAIVFDPDPIRGGKIVIQAKRYTNTVDVAAVRDLYGTVVNEGATKGILVTTSQFGPDARKFAQEKPITLIDGGNLLHLLERLGVKARIDLREAKAILAANA